MTSRHSRLVNVFRDHKTSKHVIAWLIAIIAVLIATAVPAFAQVLGQDQDIGSVPAQGSSSYNSGVYTIKGSGAGYAPSGDAYNFQYAQVTGGGNFRLIARVTGFTGLSAGSDAAVGLAVREDLNASDSMAGIEFFPEPSMSSTINYYYAMFRDTIPSPLLPTAITPNGGPQSELGGSSVLGPPSSTAPVWMMLVRYGNDFSVYRSPDGSTWTKAGDSSGGAFKVGGTIDVGVWVASGSGSTPCTATVDNVSLNTSPALSYESSWVGNSYSQTSTNYVSNGVEGFAVSPAGLVAAEDEWDEGGETLKLYEDGEIYRPMSDGAAGQWLNGSGYEGSVAWDAIPGNTANHLYFWGQNSLFESGERQIVQTDPNLNFSQYMLTQTPLANGAYGNTGTTTCSGMAATGFSVPISSVTYTGSGPITITTSNNHGLTTGQYANISGVQGVTAANGTWQVTVISATQFSLNYSSGSGTYTTNTGTVSYGTALYASDAQSDQILVMNPNPVSYLTPPSGTYAGTGADSGGTVWNNVEQTQVSLTGVSSPAPQAVYQSQFESNSGVMSFNIPGLSTTTSYTVRLHFAEFKATGSNERLMSITVGSQNVPSYDVYASAGGALKAVILPFSSVTTSTGSLTITLSSLSCPLPTPIINGIEIDNGSTAVFVLNCGGGAAASGWQSSINEVPSEDITFNPLNAQTPPTPGPIAIDKRGNLWIIAEGVPFPACDTLMTKPATYNGAVYCYSPGGSYLGQSITGLEDPIGIAYDSANDRILVADNGPDYQDVQIYNNLTTTPALYGTFGEPGGLFNGSSTDAGLVDDPSYGGYARFFGIAGVALDSSDNVYVAENYDNEFGWMDDISAFNTSGTQLLDLASLEFTDCGDFDPSTGDIYTSDHHYAMNYLNASAGSEWSNYACTWDPFQPYAGAVSGVGTPTLTPGDGTIVRHLGSSISPFVFSHITTETGNALDIYAVVGQQLVPCGQVFDDGGVVGLWIDGSESQSLDGIPESGNSGSTEVTTGPTLPAGYAGLDVDANGNIWCTCAADGIIEIPLQSVISQTGTYGTYYVPQYSVAAGKYFQYTPPAPFTYVMRDCSYAPSTDTMYLFGDTNPYTSDGTNSYTTNGATVQRINNWSQGPPWTVAWTSELPSPIMSGTIPDDFIVWGPPYGWGEGFQYTAFDVENDKVFVGEAYGTIHVLDANTGQMLPSLMSGPEVSGDDAWQDQDQFMHAHYNPADNEYDVIDENSGCFGRLNMYRWSPFAGAASVESFTISGATDASPIMITTSTAHGLVTGQTVVVNNVLGNTAANGTWIVTKVSATQIDLTTNYLTGATSTGNGTYTAGTGTLMYGGIPGDQDLGSPGKAGSASQTAGTFTVNGGGAGYGFPNGVDQANVCWSQLDGNGSIAARVTGLSGSSAASANAGVMIRNSVNANGEDPDAILFITNSNGLIFNFRPTPDSTLVNVGGVAGITPSTGEYIELVRLTVNSPGDSFAAYYSANGVQWSKIGVGVNKSGTGYTVANGVVTFATPINLTAYAGLVVCAANNSVLATGTFDHVVVGATPQPASVTPTELTAAWSNGSQSSVAVNWQAVPGVQDYNIYRGTSSGGEGGTPYVSGVATPYYSDTSVSSGNTYYYKVTAVSGGVESGKSSEAHTAAFLLWNPSFEWPNVTYGSYSPDPPSAQAGWSFTGTGGICSLQNALYGPYPYPDGGQCAYIQLGNGTISGTSPSYFSQSLSGFTVNKTYTFKFYGAQQYCAPANNEVISVYMDGAPIGSFTPADTWTWQQFSFTYKPTSGTSHTLAFAGSGMASGSVSATAFIDNITVSPAL